MKNGTKRLLVSGLMIMGLTVGPFASNLFACCTDDYTFCKSWRGDVIDDIDENCDGCTTGEITWLDC